MNFCLINTITLCRIMKDWINFNDLIRLDSALTIEAFKNKINTIYTCNYFKLKDINLTPKNIKWLSNHNIKVNSLVFKKSIIQYYEDYLNSNRNNIIKLSLCGTMINESSIKILSKFKNIRSLSLKNVTILDDQLNTMFKSMDQLENLDIEKCSLLKDSLFPHLLKSARFLKSLKLINTYPKYDTIDGICKYCKDLLSLSISHSYYINDRCISNLLSDCKAITFLELSHCPYIDNLAIIVISQKCINLKILKLMHNDKITDISPISQNCKYIENIDVTFCKNLINLKQN